MKNQLVKLKKHSLLVLFTTIFMLLSSLSQGVLAVQPISGEEAMIRQTMKNVPILAVSAASISEEETTFFSFGDEMVDETSLFYIGSVSKSFTGFAILYLAETKALSLEDSITTHIPWFSIMYQGKNVADSVTIADLLYQTSGFTNNEKQFPKADATMNLEANARNLSGRELAFSPSAQFAYANANYNLLGYIIEEVTHRSYADFMETEIFTPLGLTSIFASPQKTNATPVPGTRLSFGKAWNYAVPTSEGSVPAGYLLSSAEDLSRWLQIHLGVIEVSSPYHEIIQQSHLPNSASVVNDRTHYAAGWFVDDTDGRVYHSGGTQNYSSRLVLDPINRNATCVLTNMNASANTDDMADNMILLRQGTTDMTYRQDIWTVMDTTFSLITAACLLLLIACILLLIKNRHLQKNLRKQWYLFPGIALILAAASIFALPAIFASPWSVIVHWAPISVVVGIIALVVFVMISSFSIKKMR